MRSRHEMPFGASVNRDGVRFRLWAPAARTVALSLDEHEPPLPMPAVGGGWFALTTKEARAGTRYRYFVDGVAVPDPASRHQPEDVAGPSEVIDPLDYEWRDAEWRGRPWEEMVLYELHPGAFTASGDFAGIENRLDDLAGLGITAIELMPVADFPGRRNWGYDGVLPFAPDASYGRPEDLKRLVDACHRRGLAVFLDVVYNHFGPEGNDLGRYAPGFFTERHHTPWGAAINFDGKDAAPVRRFYVENALYWLEEFHCDGLRLDAVHAIIDDSPKHILAEIAETVHAHFDNRRAVHLVLENDRNDASWLRRDGGRPALYEAQWNDDLHHALHLLASGITSGYYADYAEAPAARLGRALAEGFVYQGEAAAHRDGARRGTPSAHLPPTAFVSFIQNHDQVGNDAFGRRLTRLADAVSVRLVAAIYLLSPQIPMLFMGEETAADEPFPFFCDFAGELARNVREGRRQEFARFPEFADASFQVRIPDPCAAATFASAKLKPAPAHREWRDWYGEMLALRRREIVPRLRGIPGGAARYEPIGDRAVVVVWRLGDGARLTLAANFDTRRAELPEAPAGRLLYATAPMPAPRRLAPRSAVFFLDEAARDERE